MPVFEAARHLKKELKAEIRGIRPRGRSVEGRDDVGVQVVGRFARRYAARSPTTITRCWMPPGCV